MSRVDALANARLVIELEDAAHRRSAPSREAWNWIWRALVLSPSLDVFEAFLRGESVPIDRCDPAWVLRLGRKPR